MKRKNYELGKILSAFALGSALLINFNGSVFANNSISLNAFLYNKELPRPQYQNQLGSFSVDLSTLKVDKEVLTNDLNAYFGLDDNNSFKLEKEHVDELGNTFYNYQHYYNDI